jgi:hypothetical protein
LTVMFGVQLAHESYPEFAEASNEAYALLTSIVHDGLQAGGLRGTDERTITLAAWSIVHGLAQLITGGQLQVKDMPPMATREMALAVTTLLHEGIAVSPVRRTREAERPGRSKAKARR